MKVLLPKNIVSQKLNIDLLDEYRTCILKKQQYLYSKNKEKYIIQDGEPYANGDLHLGHFLNKTLKDFLVKYQLQQGKKVSISFGWDCHGLPIESRAKSIDGDLIDNAKKIAVHYSSLQKKTLNKFAIYSTENDFLTMDNSFVEREINLFNELHKNGHIIKKNKPTWYSPTLKTVLANSEIEYKTIEDESIYFTMPINNEIRLLVWTTTEWTISGNQAVCINSNIEYVKTIDGFICSKKFALDNNLLYDLFDISSIKTYKNTSGEECPVIFDDYVKDENTGIVHLCGGHGDDDFRILEENKIISKNVCNKEELLDHIKNYRLKDIFVYKREKNKHEYPVDWRESNKVYKILTEQTYLDFDVDKIKKCLKQINLSSKDRNRLSTTIFSRKDWCISRQRKWGVNIPNSEDILDVWFDSGSTFTMYNTPADIYIEGSDQHRGWFQSSIILASMIDKIPTKRIITHGFVIDDTKEKLSKSKDNAKSLDYYFDKYNPDVLRLWVLMSDFKNDIVFSEESLDTAGKQYFRIRNLLRYFINNLHRESHDENNVNVETLNLINNLKINIKNNIEEFNLQKATRILIDFLIKYSSTLTEDIKNNFYESDIDSELRIKMENEFYFISKSMIDIIFPFLPFLSTELECSINDINK